MIASTMFAEEILIEYLTRQPIQNYQANIKSVSAVKQRDGIMALRIMMNDGISMMILMDSQDFLNKLAIHYLTREDARSIIQRIRQTTKDQTAVRVLPQPKDYTSQTAKAFSLNLASSLSFLNVDTSRGGNREWEVGDRSRYDDMDNGQSGTRISI